MSGVADPDVIDLPAQDADGRFLAIMIEDRSFTGRRLASLGIGLEVRVVEYL